jgi:hypothetical protein
MLHHNTKKRLVAKYSKLLKEGSTREDIKLLMAEDDVLEDETKEIFLAIDTPEEETVLMPVNADSPNTKLDLSGFDYKSLKGENFKKYVQLVGDKNYQTKNENGRYTAIEGSLLLEDNYDFQRFKAKPIRQERFEGMEGSPVDYVGIQILNDTPEHTTRITVGTALELNSQILNSHSLANNGRYYLLKK